MSKIHIQPRDILLLETLNKYNLLTTNQICSLVFHGVNKSTVLRRLRLLESKNYICQSAIMDNYSRTWQLSDKAALVIDDAKVFKVCNRNTIQHDILISDIRLKLESLGLGFEWLSYFEIKSAQGQNASFKPDKVNHSFNHINPDGIMIESLRSKNKVISLELELTLKSSSRYRELLSGYSFNDKIDFVLYVFRDMNSLKLFQKMIRIIGYHYEKLWLTVVGDVMTSDEFKIYLCREKRWITIEEMGFDSYKKPAHRVSHGVSKLDDDESLYKGEDNPLKIQLKNEIEF